TYQLIRKRPYDPYSLSTNSLYNFCKDQENGIWIGSYSGGVNYYSPFQPFTKYYAYPGESVMKGDLVHDIITDQYDNLWIATEDAGLNKLDTQTGHYTNYQPQQGRKSISRTNLHGLVAIGDKLWVGSLNGIDLLNIRSGEVLKHYTLGANSSIVIMKELPNGMLLVGTSNGMYQYQEESDLFVLHPAFPTRSRIQSILEDHTGKIWVGTAHHGIYYYDPADMMMHPFDLEKSPTFSDKVVNDIYEDEEHNLWFASFNGVKKYDFLTGDITRYTVKNGMPANSTYRILPDKSKNLWISTTNGLVCLDPVTERIKVYTQDHGIITNQFNYNSSWKDRNGRMYFGMVKGMISFIPEEIREFTNEAHVYLTNMTVFNKTVDMNIPTIPISFRESIVLTHEQSTFTINFSALSYIAPNKTEYAYCMEGLDDNWTYLKNSHTVYYTKLRPGKYTFKVRGANVSGIWSDTPTILHITILQPWWFSSSAILVYVCLCIAFCLLMVYSFIHKNRRRMLRGMQQFEDEKEKELYQAKIDFFINIAHEIRTPLTLIKSPLEKVMNNKSLQEDAKDYLSVVDKNANRLLALVNQLLDFRKTEIKGYNLNFVQVDIVTLIHDICSRFRDTAEGASLLLNVKSNTKSLYAFIDKEAFTKIISNLLSNAIKYAKANIQLFITYVENEDQFVIEVSNDGEEIPAELKAKIFEPFFRGESSLHKSGTGLGLPLARSLAEMHRGTLSVEDVVVGFTTFRLCVPINQPNSIRLEEQQSILATTNQPIYDMDSSRPTILVVEDNLEMQNFIAQEINSVYNVVVATNGHEALLILQEYSVQLILSDIMMPVIDGFDLLKKVKTELDHIPVILLTAKNTMQSRLDGLELGADAYIEKPFSMDLVMAQIANLLSNRNNMRAYYFNSPIANMKSMAYTKADENFLEKLNDIILSEIDNPNLDVVLVAGAMSMSRPTLYRKINALSNLTPNELINITRLKKAAELILEGKMKIYEISEAVGFNSQSYFSRSFSKQFGMTPSQYAQVNNVKL
ncbi:MAG: response regulator, partial [Prevotella sp.]